jgi:hypothetical protein
LDDAYTTYNGSATGMSLNATSGAVTWTSNAKNSSNRSAEITAKVKYNNVEGTAKAYTVQNADTYTTSTDYDYSCSISASPVNVLASGGTVTLSYSASYRTRTKYTWSAGSPTYGNWSGWTSATPTISGSATGFSRNGTTVTVSNRGATTGNTRSVTYTASYGTASQSVTITQGANYANAYYTYSNLSVSIGSGITAGGGSATLSATASRTPYYTSDTPGTASTVNVTNSCSFSVTHSSFSTSTT